MGYAEVLTRWAGGGLLGVLLVGCGLGSSGADGVQEDSGLTAKVRRMALAQLCQRGLACEAEQLEQVDQALQTLGAVLDGLPEQGELTQLASEDLDGPAPATSTAARTSDLAGLMEMVKAMAGTDVFGGEGEGDVAEAMAAIAAMQAGDDLMPPVSDGARPATGMSTGGTRLMADLEGVPVKPGKLTLAELREQLLIPAAEE